MRWCMVCLVLWSAWLLLAVKMQEPKVTQPEFLVVESLDNVTTFTLVCGYNFNDNTSEFRIIIYKGRIRKETEVCAASFNSSMLPFQKNQTFHCLGRPSVDTVSVTLTGLNPSGTDRYFCKVLKMYPPPIINKTGDGTVVYIKAKEKVLVPKPICVEFTQATLIVLVVLLIFLLYSIIITFAYCWAMKAPEEQSSEYVNMDPAIQNSRRQQLNPRYRT